MSCLKQITYSFEKCFGVVLAFQIWTVVDESESRASATSKLSLHAKDRNAFCLGSKGLSKLLSDLILSHICHLWVNEFNSLEKSIELTTSCLRVN